MGKLAEEFEKKAFELAGAGWKNDNRLLNTYNRLKRRDEEEQLIRETTKTIEEAFVGERKDLAFNELLEGLESLALSVVEDRAQRKEIFEKQNLLFEEKLKLIGSLKRRYDVAFALFEKSKGVLLEQLKSQFEYTRKLQTEAEEARKFHNEKIKELNSQILHYNKLTSELNQKYTEFNKKSKAFNRRVTDFNRREGFRA